MFCHHHEKHDFTVRAVLINVWKEKSKLNPGDELALQLDINKTAGIVSNSNRIIVNHLSSTKLLLRQAQPWRKYLGKTFLASV